MVDCGICDDAILNDSQTPSCLDLDTMQEAENLAMKLEILLDKLSPFLVPLLSPDRVP